LWEEETVSSKGTTSHPADGVPFFLASPNHENNLQRWKQLELWYMGYQQKRKNFVFKSASDVVSPSFVYCSDT